ncbi:MAG: alpha/beta fold hydrolase [Promethearchaeota archaeon]
MKERIIMKASDITEHSNIKRMIFVNILIGIFIIMCYFSISELFGSISSFFILNEEFSVTFGITLLLFTSFSVLAGPIHGFVSGFIGEFLYQLSFYSSIQLNWIIIIALYGLMCGYYKYKPLKYQNYMKLFFTIIILAISSIIVFLLIILSQFISDPGAFNLSIILINYGAKFLVQSFISAVFLVPLLLFIYDKFLGFQERHIYHLFLTHHPLSASDHTFYLQFGRTKIYFCSRCSGIILGGIISIFLTHLLDLTFNFRVSPEIALIGIICVPIPGLIDWGTQRLLLRKSSTTSRLITGFIIGVGLHLMNFTYKYYFITITIITVYFSILFLLMYIGFKKQMKSFREELIPISDDEYNIIFIHGLESSGKGFKAQYLKEMFPNILTPDFVKFDTEKSLKSLIFERMAQLITILEEKKNWIIIGSSYGGLMGALYTLQYPEKVERLILLAPSFDFDEFVNMKLNPVDIPVVVYHGKNDDVVPLNKSRERAKQFFNNLEYNIVEDDHYLHSTVKNINWKEVLHVD